MKRSSALKEVFAHTNFLKYIGDMIIFQTCYFRGILKNDCWKMPLINDTERTNIVEKTKTSHLNFFSAVC
ncbi:hypothetical protein Y032_0085g1819 [Ancylostoma ceylanicum]|uniref:Uncharacterized protein n=1 Tax=Ancylostoma ceylanicum TaxID=53326 RepID=A0A016TQ17_9BILA|nr:hypothetical protein Y032_0085g1819 [Ancylostoma ceylanicum]